MEFVRCIGDVDGLARLYDRFCAVEGDLVGAAKLSSAL